MWEKDGLINMGMCGNPGSAYKPMVVPIGMFMALERMPGILMCIEVEKEEAVINRIPNFLIKLIFWRKVLLRELKLTHFLNR